MATHANTGYHPRPLPQSPVHYTHSPVPPPFITPSVYTQTPAGLLSSPHANKLVLAWALHSHLHRHHSHRHTTLTRPHHLNTLTNIRAPLQVKTACFARDSVHSSGLECYMSFICEYRFKHSTSILMIGGDSINHFTALLPSKVQLSTSGPLLRFR